MKPLGRAALAGLAWLTACLVAPSALAQQPSLAELHARLLADPEIPESAKDRIRRCPLAEKVENGVRVIVDRRDRECEAFQPQREFAGLWINDFEGSRFVEGARVLSEVPGFGTGSRIWLETDSATGPPPANVRFAYGHVYRVRFRGQAAQDMNRGPLYGYGHVGMSHGLVLADEWIEVEDLGSRER